MPTTNTTRSPPLLDFSAFYSTDAHAKQNLINDVRNCCLHNGFFQLTNHRIPLSLQERVMRCNKALFSLPLSEKVKIGKDTNAYNRGYELLHSQILEPGSLPDHKEGFYIGDDLPSTHPYSVHRKLNSGPNLWPAALPDVSPEVFRETCMEYYHAVRLLAGDILSVLALTLGLEDDWFKGYVDGAVATMRMLHYPVQEKDGEEKLRRGIGAHTDFGGLTVLLQDEVDGLQVWERDGGVWLDVVPVKGAFVVNLGNLMQRWSNDRYISNTHRVINKSGKERYSIPLFFSGNPDYVVECLPNCREEGEKPKYPPITVEEAILGGYRQSYGAAEKFKAGEGSEKKELEVASGGVAVAVA